MGKYEFNRDLGKWEEVVTPTEKVDPPKKIIPITNFGVQKSFSINYVALEAEFSRSSKSRIDTFDPGDRSWSVVRNPLATMSLSFIITKIILGYGRDKFEIKGLPDEWSKILYTIGKPLTQDGSDWAFIGKVCRDLGYMIRREDHGRVFSIIKTSDGNNTQPNYSIGLNGEGGDIFDLNFLDRKGNENPTFLILGDFSIEVSSDTGFVPQVKQFLDDTGISKVVIKVPDGLSAFLRAKHVLMEGKLEEDYLANKEGTLQGEEKALFDRIDKTNASLEDWLHYYHVEIPEYNSNNPNDQGYSIHPYEGWSCSFTTLGNMWATPGEWLTIQGTSSNLYFPFQIKSVTHTFGHTWKTAYEMIR